eukprot:tig00020911_g15723.t1
MTKESVAIARSYLSRKRRRVGGGSAGRREEGTIAGQPPAEASTADSSFSLTATSSCAELKDSVSSDKEKLAAMFSKPIHAWLRLPSQAFVDQVVLGSGSSAASSEEGDSDAPPPSSCSSSSSGSSPPRSAAPSPTAPCTARTPLRAPLLHVPASTGSEAGQPPDLASKALRFNPNKPAACPATAELQVLLRAASTGTEAHGRRAARSGRRRARRQPHLPSTFTAAHCLLSVACPGL